MAIYLAFNIATMLLVANLRTYIGFSDAVELSEVRKNLPRMPSHEIDEEYKKTHYRAIQSGKVVWTGVAKKLVSTNDEAGLKEMCTEAREKFHETQDHSGFGLFSPYPGALVLRTDDPEPFVFHIEIIQCIYAKSFLFLTMAEDEESVHAIKSLYPERCTTNTFVLDEKFKHSVKLRALQKR